MVIRVILGKLLDSIIIQDQYVGLKTDNLQFGFKENTSTITCTQLLIETVEYYNSNNTDCFMLLFRVHTTSSLQKVITFYDYFS